MASDIFSLGLVMYEMLTGSPPYPGESIAELVNAQESGELVPPSERMKDGD